MTRAARSHGGNAAAQRHAHRDADGDVADGGTDAGANGEPERDPERDGPGSLFAGFSQLPGCTGRRRGRVPSSVRLAAQGRAVPGGRGSAVGA